MANNNNLTRKWEKGESGNLNGRPKGAKNRGSSLKKIISDISKISKNITNSQLHLIYQLYKISISDYVCNVTTTNIQHLYFIESDFGIKIGVSKDVNKRLEQIKNYAPSSVILKQIDFAANFETKLHKKFKRQNIKNNPIYGIEWFYKTDDLICFIDDINNVNDLCRIFGDDKIGQLLLDF
jgi:hypothetical protein